MGTLTNNTLTKYLDAIQKTQGIKSIIIAKAGENYFKSSFTKKAWSDGKWQERKDKLKHPLMNKSGDLKEAVANSASLITDKQVVFTVSEPYAAIHNYGGVIKKKKAKKVVNFRVGKNGKNRFATLENANFQQDVKIKAHSINMPKRTFMGFDSIFVNKALSIWQTTINRFMR
jgi:phage gpG-like protein